MDNYKSFVITYALFAALAVAILHLVYKRIRLSIERSKFKKAYNCQPVPKYPHKDPIFGYDYWSALNKAAESQTLLE